MSKIFHIFLIAVLAIQSGCFYKRYYRDEDWVYFEDWDRDQNSALDSLEFSAGYRESEFFKKWSSRSENITYDEFYKQIFRFLDVNDDRSIDESERARGKELYFLKEPARPGAMNEAAFNEYLSNNNVALAFDTNKDNKISEFEMAGTMFVISDDNRDNVIGSLEFYDWEIYR